MADPNKRYCACLERRPTQQDSATRIVGRAALLNAHHWGDYRTLTIGFMGGSTTVRSRVAEYARIWETSGADITFHFWLDPDVDPSTADIRISFVDGDGSWSVLGIAARSIPTNEATMNYGWLKDDLDEEEFRSVVLHEFGHALGLIHEHQNPHDSIDWNKDNVIADLSGPPNNWDSGTIEFNMFTRYDPYDLFATDADPGSIMMYPIPQHWTNDDFEVGFNSTLSENDKQLIAAAYPRSGL